MESVILHLMRVVCTAIIELSNSEFVVSHDCSFVVNSLLISPNRLYGNS